MHPKSEESIKINVSSYGKGLNNEDYPIAIPLKQNIEWAMYFTTDILVKSNKFRTLNIVD